MGSAAQPTSIRLSEATLRLLDRSAQAQARSRSHIVEEALRRYLPAEAAAENLDLRQRRLLALEELRKLADKTAVRLTSAEIEARSREFRGGD
jgi:metal-responsive CopG/Arc/MetJ family transcriptional regulator